MAMLFITHNLGTVAQIADRVAIMYAGQIVEEGAAVDIFDHPRHPYTQALLATIPRVDLEHQELAAISGRVPLLDDMPIGCRFRPRCKFATTGCERSQSLVQVDAAHRVRCHLATDPHQEAIDAKG